MNDYPIWWDTSLTIYNRYEDPQTQVVTWYKHTIEDCFWRYSSDKVSIGNTVLESSNTICRIPENADFIERYQWEQLPNDQMADYFTLGVGDIIIKGSVDDTINEYQAGHRSTDIIAKYKKLQGCLEIDQVSINTGAGRCNPHYHVKGV